MKPRRSSLIVATILTLGLSSPAQTPLAPTLLVDDFRTDLHGGTGGPLPARSTGSPDFLCPWFASFTGTHDIENVPSEIRTGTPGYRNYSNRGLGRVIDGTGLSERSLPHGAIGDIWVSFLARPTASVFTTASVALTEGNTIATNCGAPRGFQFGVSPSSGQSFARTCVSGNYCSGPVTYGAISGPQPYLVIAKIVIGVQDSIDVWVNPPDLTNGEAGLGTPNVSIPGSALPSGFAAAYVSTVSIDVQNNARIDALRIAYGFVPSDDKLAAVLNGTWSRYPGNGSDFGIDVSVAAVSNRYGEHVVPAGLPVTMTFASRRLSLYCPINPGCFQVPASPSILANPMDGAPFLVAGYLGPPTPTSLWSPTAPPTLWLDLNYFPIVGGIGISNAPSPLFLLSPNGYQLSFIPPAQLAGQDLTIQMAAWDPRAPGGLGLSDAHWFQFQ